MTSWRPWWDPRPVPPRAPAREIPPAPEPAQAPEPALFVDASPDVCDFEVKIAIVLDLRARGIT